jgi:TRAP-type C4-dicarboxylate transport system permease small subunit
MHFIDTIYGKVAALLNYLACIWFAAVLVIVITSAAARYFFNSPFGFTEELVGLLISTMLLMAIPLNYHENKHIRVTMVSDHFKGWLKKAAWIFACFVTLVFTSWFGYASLEWLGFAAELNLKTTNTGIPLTPWMMVLTSVMFLVAIAGLISLLKIITKADESTEPAPEGGE